jgi:hypothetical protein
VIFFVVVRKGRFETVIASQRVGAKRRSMINSAKQSIAPHNAIMDCFVAEFIIGPAEGGTRWLLAMTGRRYQRG